MKAVFFNTKEIKDTQDNSKSQFTRLIPTSPIHWGNPELLKPDYSVKFSYSAGGCQNHSAAPHFETSKYMIGDILYVKETFAENFGVQKRAVYKSEFDNDEPLSLKWKPSSQMPKRYAKLFLEITEIEVARVNDLSTIEKIEEGYPVCNSIQWLSGDKRGASAEDVYRWFINKWDSKAVISDYKWENNPYIYIYKFKKIEKNKIKEIK